MNEEFYNRHYVTARPDGVIIDVWSDGPHPEKDTETAICINEQGGYQFRLYPGGEENPPIYDMDGIPLYKWDGSQVVSRTEHEIKAERAAIPAPPPSAQEQLRAEVDKLAAAQSDTANISAQLSVAAELYVRRATDIPDAAALEMPDLFPTWEESLEAGAKLAAGAILSRDGQLYRAVQTVTPQAHQKPGGEGMLAIYRPIDREHAGTLGDPIPWAYGMDCLTGLYYSHEGVTYLCKGDMIPCVWAPGSAGLWQWEFAAGGHRAGA